MPRLRDMLTPWRRRKARAAGAPSTRDAGPGAPASALPADIEFVGYAKPKSVGHCECYRRKLADDPDFTVEVECLCGYKIACVDDADATRAIDSHAQLANLMKAGGRR
jgi:hypothetical protein